MIQPPLWPEPPAEPRWRVAAIGPVHAIHDPRCVLDPRHHIKTPCAWWAGDVR